MLSLKKTKIISAFPGMGKSYFYNKYKNNGVDILDSDSSNFSWIWSLNHTRKSNVRDLTFPDNYIKHIKENMNKVDIIFVSSHDVVRQALIDNEIEFDLVYPRVDRKEEMIKLYIERGNDVEFVERLNNNFEEFIFQIIASNNEYQHKIALPKNTFIEDYYIEEFKKKYKLY